MGNALAMCGLGPAANHDDPHLEFIKDENRPATSHERSRAQSLTAADTSVASILLHSDELIPEAFQPVDIQVLARGKRRSAHSGGNTPSRIAHQPPHPPVPLRNSIGGSASVTTPTRHLAGGGGDDTADSPLGASNSNSRTG